MTIKTRAILIGHMAEIIKALDEFMIDPAILSHTRDNIAGTKSRVKEALHLLIEDIPDGCVKH